MGPLELKRKAALDFWLARNDPKADHFSAQLFRMFMKSDFNNLSRFEKAFPLEVEVFREWQQSKTEAAFFESYGIDREPGLGGKVIPIDFPTALGEHETKIFEIRDSGTFIPAMAVRLKPTTESERYLLARAGYGRSTAEQSEYVLLLRIAGDYLTGSSDIYGHGDSRTFANAHKYIIENWERLRTGQVVDVQFILGETQEPTPSEREVV